MINHSVAVVFLYCVGSPDAECPNYPNNVGLWVDVLTFAVFAIQIAIFDSQYSEMMREYLIDRSKRAGQ